jgi:hypothetical protein
MRNLLFKKATWAAIASIALALAGCSAEGYDDSELRGQLDDHSSRLAALEQWKNTVNTNIASLQQVIDAGQNNRQVQSVTPFDTPAPGGWTITFSSGTPASIQILNGAKGDTGAAGPQGGAGDTPQIGVDQFPAGSGVYYWTLDGNFIETGGQKMRVTGDNGQTGENGISPKLDIDEVANEWIISYDNGETWESLGVPATGADGANGNDGVNGAGEAIFSSVDSSNDDYVIFTLVGGGTMQLPRYKSIDIVIDPIPGFGEGTHELVDFTTSGEVSVVRALDVTEGWIVYVTYDPDSGTGLFNIEAPASFVDNKQGSALVMISDGKERTVLRTLEFGAEVEGLSITSPATRTVYGIGQPLDYSGVAVEAVYVGGAGSEPVILTPTMFSYDFSVAGANIPVTITAHGMTVKYNVTVETLSQRIANTNTGSSTIDLFADEEIASAITIPGGKTITLRSSGNAKRTLGLSARGRMFTISGGSLALGINITLEGMAGNNAPLVYAASGTLLMGQGATICYNENISTNGGGVYLGNGSTLLMTGGDIGGNKAPNGGGIYQDNGGNVLLIGGMISENSAINGGGVYINSGTLQPALECTIAENFVSGMGGGVYVAPGATLNAASAIISSNYAQPGATVMGRDVYVHCSGTTTGNLTVGNSTQIDYLCMFANSAANCKITLASGAYSGTAPIVYSLDLRGDDPQLANVVPMWEDKVILGPANISSAIVSRIALGRFWNGSAPYASQNIVSGALVQQRLRINSTTGELDRPGKVVVRP